MSVPLLHGEPGDRSGGQAAGTAALRNRWIHAVYKIDPALPLLLVLPFLLLLLDPNWIFSDIYNDPWIYFGFFLNLPNHLQAFGDLYYSDRLTILIPGYLCHLVLPDKAAHYVLHLGLYYIAVFSIYLTLRVTVGRRAAFLAALAMGCHYFFLKAVGWDYFDGFVIAYLSLTIFLLVVGGNTGLWRSALVLAGSTATAALVANPGCLLLVVSLTPLVLSVRGSMSWWAIAFRTLLLAVGALFLVLALEGVYISISGHPWTLAGTRTFLTAIASQPDKCVYPVSWWWHASWLVFPGLSVVWGTQVLYFTRP